MVVAAISVGLGLGSLCASTGVDYLHADGTHRRLIDLRPIITDQIVWTGRPLNHRGATAVHIELTALLKSTAATHSRSSLGW